MTRVMEQSKRTGVMDVFIGRLYVRSLRSCFVRENIGCIFHK